LITSSKRALGIIHLKPTLVELGATLPFRRLLTATGHVNRHLHERVLWTVAAKQSTLKIPRVVFRPPVE